MSVKKIFIIIFLYINAIAFAQNELHKKVADIFMKDFNNSDFEQIYQTFSPEMKELRTKEHHLAFLAKVKKSQGNLLFLELSDYLENSGKTRGNYNGSFQFGNAFIRITNNPKGEIIGLYIKKNTLL